MRQKPRAIGFRPRVVALPPIIKVGKSLLPVDQDQGGIFDLGHCRYLRLACLLALDYPIRKWHK